MLRSWRGCRLIDAAISFQDGLAAMIATLAEHGYLAVREPFTVEMMAQTLANGARGVNQALPPLRR